MSDALARAWELRSAVHALIRANPDCRMPLIIAAFPESSRCNLAAILKRLRKAGMLTQSGTDKRKVYYRAIGDHIEPRDAVRDALRASGLRQSERNRASKLEMQRLVGLAAGNADKLALVAAQYHTNGTPRVAPPGHETWRYTNQPWKHRPIKNQGGQFDRSGRLNGCSALA